MNNKLDRIAKKIILSFKFKERDYLIHGNKENSFLVLRFKPQIWKEISRTPEWAEIIESINPECHGTYYGINQSCVNKAADGYNFVELKFDGTNDKDHKSPSDMFTNNLKKLGF